MFVPLCFRFGTAANIKVRIVLLIPAVRRLTVKRIGFSQFDRSPGWIGSRQDFVVNPKEPEATKAAQRAHSVASVRKENWRPDV